MLRLSAEHFTLMGLSFFSVLILAIIKSSTKAVFKQSSSTDEVKMETDLTYRPVLPELQEV